jgi:LysM repeat protein
MLRIDVDAPAPVWLASTVGRASASFLFVCCGIAVLTGATVAAAQCSAQDVAGAARQEHGRKETQQKKSKHVYMDEDLKRAKILTPEDREQVEARKNPPAPATDKKSPDPVDAQSLPADAPLGDVARHFRREKESQEQRRAQQFALPLTDAPVLASPKPLVRSLRPKFPLASPVAPPLAKSISPGVVPFRPPVKRSPFSRPKFFMSAPPRVSRSRPSPPGFSSPGPVAPAASAKPPAHFVPTQPPAKVSPSYSTNLRSVIVERGDSLWKLAQRNLGRGYLWRALLAVNPHLRDANHIETGSRIFLPASASSRASTTLSVQSGDSLSRIARARFGHASSWSCIARANPSISDPNLIFPGQILALPASCEP